MSTSPLAIGHLTSAIREGKTPQFIKTAEAFKTVAGSVNALSSTVQGISSQVASIVFPTGVVLMRHDLNGAWSVYGPSGNVVPTVGSTTQGLQEAINYAQQSGYMLIVQGGGITPPPGTRAVSRITTKTPISIPPSDFNGYIFNNVDLLYDVQGGADVTKDFITFDSFDGLKFMFTGQIIYPGNASAVRMNPVHDNGETFIGGTSSWIDISTIAIVNPTTLAPESTHGAGVRISATNGVIINNRFTVGEVNGGLTGIQIDNPGAGKAFNLNQIFANAIHGQGSIGATIGTSAITDLIYGNQWFLQLNPLTGGGTVALQLFGGSDGGGDDFYVSIQGGSTGILFNTTAARNRVTCARNNSTTLLTDISTAKNNIYPSGRYHQEVSTPHGVTTNIVPSTRVLYPGDRLTIALTTDGTDGAQITWDATLKGASPDDFDGSANRVNIYEFEGMANGNWRLLSRTLGEAA